MRPDELNSYRLPPAWRWLSARLWSLEHAYERATASGRLQDDARIRILFVLAMFTAGFLTLAVGATHSALFSDAGKNTGTLAAPSGARADLVDRNGQLLAVDLPHYGLYVDSREIWDVSETRTALMATIPGLTRERLDKALRSDRREYLVGGLTPEQRAVVHNLGLPGVVFEEESRRVYPLGSTAAHIIGFSDRGGAGIAGSELALDDTVRKLAAVPGQSVPLSIDLRVQTALEDELQKNAVSFQATGAVGLVTNVRTGEILALASYPDFNPNRPGLTPPNNLLNRAAASVFEMGSIFKVFTVAMGLDTGRVNLSTTFDATTPITVGGQTIHDFHAEKRVMTLSDIFLHSSNIGTAKLALTIGGPTMERYFQSFGLFAPAKIELAETTHPILPHRWSENIVASASFGHAMSVSPLAVASGMGAILNGGNLVPLTIRKVEAGAVPAGKRVISEATSRSMLDLMRLNVTHGTGASAERAAPGLRVGGKTGSAEKVVAGRYDRSKLVSSFAAVFPTDGPIDSDRYFILILVDEPKGNKESYGFATGGWTAAPAVGRVAERIAPYLGVRRMETATDAPAVTPERLSGGDR